MLTTELHDAAVEFGLALRQAPAVAAYRAAAEAFENDSAAQALMAELREQQAGFTRAQQTGLTPGPEQVDRLRQCQAEVRANDVIMAHLRTTNEVKAYLPGVALEVSAALGADFGSLAAPAGC